MSSQQPTPMDPYFTPMFPHFFAFATATPSSPSLPRSYDPGAGVSDLTPSAEAVADAWRSEQAPGITAPRVLNPKSSFLDQALVLVGEVARVLSCIQEFSPPGTVEALEEALAGELSDATRDINTATMRILKFIGSGYRPAAHPVCNEDSMSGGGEGEFEKSLVG